MWPLPGTSTFFESEGNVGPVTLKKSPIAILAPTIPAIKSHVAHLLEIFIVLCGFCISGEFAIKQFSIG